MPLPREIIERVERIGEYHRATKHTYKSVHDARPINPAEQTNPYRVFDDRLKIPLPTRLLDAPEPTLSLMTGGFDALPESQLNFPQDIRTLASWLFMAYGVTKQRKPGPGEPASAARWRRSCPSAEDTYPCEIYVAAFAIEGLEPGFYHYCAREFALRRLRGAWESLLQIKRGRPDLEFIKTVPAVLLVSTIFCRSSWRFRKRGYRDCLHDAGHLVQNLVTAGLGLGLRTLVRQVVNENNMRELIGLTPDATYAEEESVQTMVVWADEAKNPIKPPAIKIVGADIGGAELRGTNVPATNVAGANIDGAKVQGSGIAGQNVSKPNIPGSAVARAPLSAQAGVAGFTLHVAGPLPTADSLALSTHAPLTPGQPAQGLIPIPRKALAAEVTSFGSILAVHNDCVAPGVAVREIRPPLTEILILAADYPTAPFPVPPPPDGGMPLRKLLLTRTVADRYLRNRMITRDSLWTINRAAFRGGAYFPLFPDGPHAALVRPLWAINGVSGMENGIWHYHVKTDKWSLMRSEQTRVELQYAMLEEFACGEASAVCFMAAHLSHLTRVGGPDLYRLAHLEAGACGQRIYLAANAQSLGASMHGGFYDEDVRILLGISTTQWDIIYVAAVGLVEEPRETELAPAQDDLEGGWKG
jgi:SagB-type dehydrogenase family enzyme